MQNCELCGKRPATIFIKTNINGVTTERHVCSECAKKLQTGNIFADIFDDDFAGKFFEENVFDQAIMPNKQRVCKCGTTEKDVLENYKFGCSECYKTFSDIADRYVGRLGGKAYSGIDQTPMKIEEKNKPKSKVEMLKEELDQAVANQDFMKAYQLKQEIMQLEQGDKK